jgi:hypothetical protein
MHYNLERYKDQQIDLQTMIRPYQEQIEQLTTPYN